MQTLVHADIFFFISTIALVVLSIGAAVGLYYVIGILRDVREVSMRLKKASVEGVADVVLNKITSLWLKKIIRKKRQSKQESKQVE